MKRWTARILILLALTAVGVIAPDTERTTYEPLTGGVLTPGRPIVPRTVPRPVMAFPALSSASGALTYQPATPRPATAEPAATTPPATAPARDTWETIFASMAAQLPGTYVVRDAGSWGLTPNDQGGLVYIARRTPVNRLADVMRHESIHVRQTRVYGSATAAYNALKSFGGWEAVADCGARMIGAHWTNYVQSCTDSMSHAARAILNGVPA